MTRRPARAAAALAFALAFSSLAAATPSVAVTTPGLPTEVAIVIPITVPESTTGIIDAEALERYTSSFGLLTRTLDQVIGRPVTLAIDPMIIASIRLLGTDAPESATEWLNRLASATNDTFRLTWADSNIALGLAAGSPVILAPESLDFAIDPARFGAADTSPSPTPSASENPGNEPDDNQSPPPLPTTADLLLWNYTLPSIAWPATASLNSAALTAIADSVDQTLIASADLNGLGGPTSTASVDGAPVLVSDSPLSTLLGVTVEATPGLDWQTAVAALDIAISTSAQSASASSMILTLNRGVSTSDSELGPTIDSLAVNPLIALVGLSSVADNPRADATLIDAQLDASTVATVAALLSQESLDSDFSLIAETPSLITSDRRLSLLATLSNAWSLNPTGWQTAFSEYRQDSVDLRAKVKIVKSSTITLLADRGTLPVTVSNELNQPVTVTVTVRPLTPLIRVENSFVEVTVEPESQRKAQIPVQSISNGNVELEISLHGASSQQVGLTTYVRTNVQAGWETPFTIVVGVLVVLVFIGGILRTIVRRRRAPNEREIGA